MARKLDIIVCTFNREKEMLDCITSLMNQRSVHAEWGLIVVNNHSQPLSDQLSILISEIDKAQIIQEAEPGLSLARNQGTMSSRAEWLGFLDDDARVTDSFIWQVIDVIDREDFDCFGGHIRSWWKYGRPHWLDESFGSKPVLRSDRGYLKEDFNWGSNIFIRRRALLDVGCFPWNVGLKGKHLGYAAENIVQIRLREKDYKVGYDPQLQIDHAVLPHKLKIWWHIRSAYATGRDGKEVFPEQYTIRGMLVTLKNCFTRPLKALWKWVTRKNYYWQNMITDSGKAWALWWGKVMS